MGAPDGKAAVSAQGSAGRPPGAARHPAPRRPSQRAPRVPPELDEICRKALAVSRGDRYRDCDAMKTALQSWLAHNAPDAAARTAALMETLFAETFRANAPSATTRCGGARAR